MNGGAREGFQVSVSTLTLGTLYEAVLAFSSQERFETFWPSVCLNARWIIPSKRLGVVLHRDPGLFRIVGMFGNGQFQPPEDAEWSPGEELARALSQPTAQWIEDPATRLQEEAHGFTNRMIRDEPDVLFVLPLRVKRKNIGAMLFAISMVTDSDRAMLNTLGTIYALHVGMTYELLRGNEERRHMQNQLITQKKMASLGSLVAGVLHEINTPLGTALSANDVAARCVAKLQNALEEGSDVSKDEACRQVFDLLRVNTGLIRQAGERITTIVKSLKNFARLDEAEYQTVSLKEGLESTLTLLASQLRNRIDVVTEYGELPPIRCCPGEMNQVFMNLLTNAIDAIDGKGSVRIKTFEANDQVHVEISDSGRGIARERLGSIFELDFSKRGSRVKMGAGLATANTIVERHGGRIDVKSELGSGSTFAVVLPTGRESSVAGIAPAPRLRDSHRTLKRAPLTERS